MSDAQLAAEFARDLGSALLALVGAWFVLAATWTMWQLWKVYRR